MSRKKELPQRFTVFSDELSTRNPIGQADTGFTTKDLGSVDPRRHRRTQHDHQPVLRRHLPEQGGYNSTVPRPFGFTTPVVEADPPVLDIQLSGSDDLDHLGPWRARILGCDWRNLGSCPGATSPYTPTVQDTQHFYRARDGGQIQFQSSE
jgi:hypothetical protein